MVLAPLREGMNPLRKLELAPWRQVEQVTTPLRGTEGSQRSGLVVQGNIAAPTLRWLATPFPLQEHQGWCESVQQLYQHAGEQKLAAHQMAALGLKACHPEMDLEAIMSLNN